MCIGSKVLVVGCCGSGKSTFARELGQRTGIPVTHLDALFWNADGTHVSREEFRRRVDEVMRKDAWILDGDFSSTYEQRIVASHTVVFLDYDEKTCLEGAAARLGHKRPDLPWVETELSPELAAHIHAYATKTRPKLLSLLAAHPDKALIAFKTRSDADAWLRDL